MEIETIGQNIEFYSHQTFDKKAALQEKYSWSETDARITVLGKLNNILNSVSLGYFFMHTYLKNESWWEQYQKLDITIETIQTSTNEFEMFFRIGLIQNLTYCIESSFRIYVRALDPNACNKGQSEFKNIYEWLLKKLNLQTGNIDLLDLLRNIRNTMHNNGLFFPANGKNQTVIYKSNSFNFEVGKPNDFVNTELIVGLIPDLLDLVEKVVLSRPIMDMTSIREIS